MASNDGPTNEQGSKKTDVQDTVASVSAMINEFKRDVESRDRKQKTTDDLKETWNRRTAIGVFIYTGLTAIITVAAILQSCEAGRSTDAANRAWLGPMQLNLLQPIESLPSRMQLHVINFGREPANGVVWKMTPTLAPYLEDDARGASDEKKMGVKNSTCDGLHPSDGDGLVIYPLQQYALPEPITDSAENRDIRNKVLAKTGTLLVQGCLGYVTYGKPHFSKFEFFLRDVAGRPSNEWPFNAPPEGNHAD